jgi:hypothetical protein
MPGRPPSGGFSTTEDRGRAGGNRGSPARCRSRAGRRRPTPARGRSRGRRRRVIAARGGRLRLVAEEGHGALESQARGEEERGSRWAPAGSAGPAEALHPTAAASARNGIAACMDRVCLKRAGEQGDDRRQEEERPPDAPVSTRATRKGERPGPPSGGCRSRSRTRVRRCARSAGRCAFLARRPRGSRTAFPTSACPSHRRRGAPRTRIRQAPRPRIARHDLSTRSRLRAARAPRLAPAQGERRATRRFRRPGLTGRDVFGSREGRPQQKRRRDRARNSVEP